VTDETAKAADTARKKLTKPAADAVSSGLTLPSAIPVEEMKNMGMPRPMIMMGNTISQYVMSVLLNMRKPVTSDNQSAPAQIKRRRSTRLAKRVTMGAIQIDNRAVHAVV